MDNRIPDKSNWQRVLRAELKPLITPYRPGSALQPTPTFSRGFDTQPFDFEITYLGRMEHQGELVDVSHSVIVAGSLRSEWRKLMRPINNLGDGYAQEDGLLGAPPVQLLVYTAGSRTPPLHQRTIALPPPLEAGLTPEYRVEAVELPLIGQYFYIGLIFYNVALLVCLLTFHTFRSVFNQPLGYAGLALLPLVYPTLRLWQYYHYFHGASLVLRQEPAGWIVTFPRTNPERLLDMNLRLHLVQHFHTRLMQTPTGRRTVYEQTSYLMDHPYTDSKAGNYRLILPSPEEWLPGTLQAPTFRVEWKLALTFKPNYLPGIRRTWPLTVATKVITSSR